MSSLTPEEFKAALPAKLKKSVSQDLMDSINNTITDPEEYERFRDNLLSYTSVLQSGRFKVESYLNAVRYVSYKLANLENKTAYFKTFPEKLARFKLEEVPTKDITSYIYAYHHSKLVTLIFEQTLTPTWIVNQDLYQKGLNVLSELMLGAHSEKVRCDAATNLLTQLKQPETQKIQLDVGLKENKTIDDLRANVLKLAAKEKAMLQAGLMQAEEVAHSQLLIDADYEEVE
jgi:hypothetical protein